VVEDLSWLGGSAVAAIGIVSSWLAGRSARKAAQFSADASTANERTKAETEAYSRARAMDIQTIARQEAEIKKLSDKITFLEGENAVLKERVANLERGRRRSG
jgi:predicted RNase H-like nuclease (RuvC/YqgF family)